MAREKVLIDPAHDFGKNTHGLLLLRHVADLVMTGWPVPMALSNKDVVGETLGVGFDQTAFEGTLAATALAPYAGAHAWVHEVAAAWRCWKWWHRFKPMPARTVRGPYDSIGWSPAMPRRWQGPRRAALHSLAPSRLDDREQR